MNKRAGQQFVSRDGVYGTEQYCKKVARNRARNKAARVARKKNRGKK